MVFFAMACGDDGDIVPSSSTPDGSPPDAPPDVLVSGNDDIEGFCKGTLGLYAPMYEACCDPSVAPKRYSFDNGVLKGLLVACTTTLGKSVQSGRATLNSAAAATCAANVSKEVQARTCPDVLRAPSNQTPKSIFKEAAGCSEVLVGQQGVDAPCAKDHECVDGLTCVGWTSESDGICKTPPGSGAPCAYAVPDGGGFVEVLRWGFGTHPRCAAGYYCASSAFQQGTCQPSKSAEASCDSDDECAEGLRCQLGVCGTAGPAPAGAPCERSSDCQDRLHCKSADGGSLCAPREVAGTPCSSELGSECQGACVKPDGGGAASCVAFCGSQ